MFKDLFTRIASMLARIVGRRMAQLFYFAVILQVVLACWQPQLLPVSLYKLALIATAAWLGYWIDRALFPYARPHSFFESAFSPGAPLQVMVTPSTMPGVALLCVAMLRRALIIAAAMIAAALGA